jgi:hypothetical protein
MPYAELLAVEESETNDTAYGWILVNVVAVALLCLAFWAAVIAGIVWLA